MCRVTGPTTGRSPLDSNESDFTCVVRSPTSAVLAWAAVVFIIAPLVSPVSGDPSITFVEGLPSTLNYPISSQTAPICWEAQGIHERDCFHPEPLTAETYPLTLEMLQRASSRYTTTDLSLHRAFQRARKRGLLKVIVVGGSVTFGHVCVSPAGLTGVDCAWPNRLQQWFGERVEDFAVEVRELLIDKTPCFGCYVKFRFRGIFTVRTLDYR